MIKKLVIIIFILSLSIHTIYCQVVEIDTQDHQKIDILSYANLADAGNTEYTISEIIKSPPQLVYQKLTGRPDIGFTNHHYWLSFSIRNNNKKTLTWYLETARPITDNVDLYLYEDNAPQSFVEEQHSGDNVAFEKRPVPFRKVMFALSLEPLQTYRVYIHYKSDGEVLLLPLTLYSPNRFTDVITSENLWFGVFYGILCLVAITYWLFYAGLKDKSFLFYVLYVIFIGLLQFALDGMFYRYAIPSANWLYMRSVVLLALVSPYFFSKYVRTYLNIEGDFKTLSKVYSLLNIILVIAFILVLINPKAIEYSYPIANIVGLLVLLLIITTMVLLWIKKRKIDFFFTIGIFALVAGFTVFILDNLNVIPHTVFTEYSTKLGTGVEVVFLSLSMARRIRLLRTDKEKIQGIALQKAEEASELKSYFMSNISHELRTPLNAIMGISDVMIKEVMDEKIKTNFEIIKYSSLSLLSSVNDILDYSKLQKGEITLENEILEPSAIFEQIRNTYSPEIKSMGIEFDYIVQEGMPRYIYGDSPRLAQIVNNLLGNAVKFTVSGKIQLAVSYTQAGNDKIYLQIAITDTGIGISQNKLDTIFSGFLQENINNKRKYGGLGLGLSIVKELVNMHKGTIHLDSEAGKGTRCFVSLPYTIAHKSDEKTAFPTDTFDLLGTNILVVEDDAVNQLIMKTILSRWKNTRIYIVGNGRLALDELMREKYDVVLMDLQMPEMDGYEATEEIRKGTAGENNRTIPIIAITADTMETTRRRAKEIGITEYMTKPVDQVILYGKITSVLQPKY